MLEHAFGESATLSLGVEEELMILDVATYEQVAAVDRILRQVEGVELPGRLKTELFASVLETNTDDLTGAQEGEHFESSCTRAVSHRGYAEIRPKIGNSESGGGG